MHATCLYPAGFLCSSRISVGWPEYPGAGRLQGEAGETRKMREGTKETEGKGKNPDGTTLLVLMGAAAQPPLHPLPRTGISHLDQSLHAKLVSN